MARPAVAFIGLGMMGRPMAALLAHAGFRLAANDLNDEVACQFAAEHAGSRRAADPADAAREADIVVTMLPASGDVAAALRGSERTPGALSTLRRGALVIDMSSCDPMSTRALAADVAHAGGTMVDAPVSGGVKRAREGKLAIMVGGSADAVARCKDLFDALGTTVHHVGDIGAGHAMKALNNYVSAAGLVAAVEALHVGRAFGLDPAVMTQVLNTSTGKNNATENKVAQFMLSGAFDSGFSLALMAKDLGIAMRLADELGQPATMGHVCERLWREAGARAPKGADHTEMYRLVDSPG